MRRTPTRPQSVLLSPVRALLACAAVALPLSAQAQIEDALPRWVVVTKDAAPVRCDDFERFYKVASLDTGSVLRSDGQSNEWARVIYPLGVPALVPATDVRVLDDKTVELTTPSRLRAPSAILGIAGSWRSLYSEAIPAGTRLEIIERELGANDEVAAYRVKAPEPPVAPEPPYAYIKLDFVRDATKAETDAHLIALSAIPGASPVPVKTAEIIPDAVEVTDDLVTDATEQGEEVINAEPDALVIETIEPADITADVIELSNDDLVTDATNPNAGAGANSLLEPMVLPGEEETVADDARESAPTGAARTETDAQAEPIAMAQPELAPEPASIEDLELSLTSVRRLPREALDEALDELYAEYQRTLGATEAKGEDEKILSAIRRRVAWLELRIETRNQRRALDAVLSEASSRDDAIASGVRTWQAGRSYAMVGRLAPSAVYNGDRLPLMYRVQSVDPLTGPRTIGYVRPREGQRLDGNLGQIVGIIGSTTDDDALSLRIIRPERVDVLDTSSFANVPTD